MRTNREEFGRVRVRRGHDLGPPALIGLILIPRCHRRRRLWAGTCSKILDNGRLSHELVHARGIQNRDAFRGRDFVVCPPNREPKEDGGRDATDCKLFRCKQGDKCGSGARFLPSPSLRGGSGTGKSVARTARGANTANIWLGCKSTMTGCRAR